MLFLQSTAAVDNRLSSTVLTSQEAEVTTQVITTGESITTSATQEAEVTTQVITTGESITTSATQEAEVTTQVITTGESITTSATQEAEVTTQVITTGESDVISTRDGANSTLSAASIHIQSNSKPPSTDTGTPKGQYTTTPSMVSIDLFGEATELALASETVSIDTEKVTFRDTTITTDNVNGITTSNTSVVVGATNASTITLSSQLRARLQMVRSSIKPFYSAPTEAPHAKEVGGSTSVVCLILFVVCVFLLDSTCIERDLNFLKRNLKRR